MSGIYIKMEMPESCFSCPMDQGNYKTEQRAFIQCGITGKILSYCEFTKDHPRLDNCPLIPVPDHGRLIDADALEADLNIWKGDYADPAFSEAAIEEAPTIIPADKSGVWIDDGDCLICTTCKKAMDFHSRPDANGVAEYPARCPHCGDCKHEVRKE